MDVNGPPVRPMSTATAPTALRRVLALLSTGCVPRPPPPSPTPALLSLAPPSDLPFPYSPRFPPSM